MGYIEEFIEKRKEKNWDAYLAIDIKEKTGKEEIPGYLPKCHEGEILREKMEKILEAVEKSGDSEIYLTDDGILLEEEDSLMCLIELLYGTNILVHLRVKQEWVELFKRKLDHCIDVLTRDLTLLIDWEYLDDNFVLELRQSGRGIGIKRIMKIYEDGNVCMAFPMYGEKDGCQSYYTKYAKLKEDSLIELLEKATVKVDAIIKNSKFPYEDDREFGFMFRLRYGIKWHCPDAWRYLKDPYLFYENYEYANEAWEFPILEDMLNIPEVRELWRDD